MLFKSFAIAVLSAVTVSAQVSAIPACADTCILTAVSDAGCAISDYYCQCTTGKAKITTEATSCLLKSSCTVGQINNITVAIGNICASAIAAGPTPGSASATSNTTTSNSSSSSSSSSAGSSTSSAAATQSSSSANMLSAGSALLGLSLAAIFAL
ncbi:hypothetical protein ANO11243_085750 [Dothideomycetidae sp. 11243]|nr:hypothetical protein ANO11243_085750 [fungal sp. No.11243]